MAINLQQKPPTAVWWIVGLIALLLLVWLLFAWDTEMSMTTVRGATPQTNMWPAG